MSMQLITMRAAQAACYAPGSVYNGEKSELNRVPSMLLSPTSRGVGP